MSYQVLARKWRPQRFDTLVGQEHVVRALSHALSSQRLHHAYLFTGTRGVGKTTLSRILAKTLNCETGITPTPCGVCSACVDIDAGLFTDYVEMDAASNRSVEDMAALLDRAAYAPVRGRFKVYMIDEVHMLSTTAFNSMLKTLEEPPEYLKFILATTDPQKIPVTVLSRCLQFSLKPMSPEQIAGHLSHVLTQESIAAEPAALESVARAAQGSMRDALSILDQAISHGAGQLTAAGVRSMLGVADTSGVYTILEALTQRSTANALTAGQALLDAGVSASNVLQELAAMACRLAVLQASPLSATTLISHADQALLAAASAMSAEHVQLVYGIALRGIQDAPFAPNEYAALAMPVLRMQVFAPMGGGTVTAPTVQTAFRTTAPHSLTAAATTPAPTPTPTPLVTPTPPAAPAMPSIPVQSQPPVTAESHQQIPRQVAPVNPPVPSSIVLGNPADWPAIANGLPLAALARTAARQSACTHIDGLNIHLALPTSQLAAPDLTKRVQDALRSVSGKNYQLHTTVVESSAAALTQTASAHDQVQQVQVQNAAEQAFHADDLVKGLIAAGAQVVAGSIKPVSE